MIFNKKQIKEYYDSCYKKINEAKDACVSKQTIEKCIEYLNNN